MNVKTAWRYGRSDTVRIIWIFNVSFSRGTTAELFDNSMATIDVSLRVSKSANKWQYERYEIREMTKLTMVNQWHFLSHGFLQCEPCEVRHKKWTTTGETRKQDVKARAFKKKKLVQIYYYIILFLWQVNKTRDSEEQIPQVSFLTGRKKHETWKFIVYRALMLSLLQFHPVFSQGVLA